MQEKGRYFETKKFLTSILWGWKIWFVISEDTLWPEATLGPQQLHIALSDSWINMKINSKNSRYCFTDETRKIYNSLKLAPSEHEDPEVILRSLEDWVEDRVHNSVQHRYYFHSRMQKPDEPFENFLKVKNCWITIFIHECRNPMNLLKTSWR